MFFGRSILDLAIPFWLIYGPLVVAAFAHIYMSPALALLTRTRQAFLFGATIFIVHVGEIIYDNPESNDCRIVGAMNLSFIFMVFEFFEFKAFGRMVEKWVVIPVEFQTREEEEQKK
jgi:hypothetical protein